MCVIVTKDYFEIIRLFLIFLSSKYGIELEAKLKIVVTCLSFFNVSYSDHTAMIV